MNRLLPAIVLASSVLTPPATQPLVACGARNAFAAWFVQYRLAPRTGRLVHRWNNRPGGEHGGRAILLLLHHGGGREEHQHGNEKEQRRLATRRCSYYHEFCSRTHMVNLVMVFVLGLVLYEFRLVFGSLPQP
jgi:hypothetical protein